MRSLRTLTVAALLLLLGAGPASAMFASRESRPRQPVQVVVVPGMSVADLTGLANRGAAIGLLVPSAGPRTSERMAFEAMIRGLLYNARVGSNPRGKILIDAHYSRAPPGHGPAIILGLPPKIATSNDRRYPIAVFGYGYHGLLISPLTRVPGLVSMADVVPTALQWQRPLRAQRVGDPVQRVAALESRIDIARSTTLLGLVVVLTLTLLLGLLRRGAAPAAVAAALLGNLALGLIAGGSVTTRLFLLGCVTVLGGLAGPALARRPLAFGLGLAGVMAAYLVTMATEPWIVSLAPLSPELTSRFYGVSNLLETLLLVPALLGAKLLWERLGPVGFAGIACLSLVTIAENRFGDDGGGAVVLGVAYAALAVLLTGHGWRAFTAALAGSGMLVYALATADAAIAGPNHLRGALNGGLDGLASVVSGRVPLSYARALDQWYFVFPLVATAALGWLAVRRGTRSERALAISLLAALPVSLLVNDSPAAISFAGLAAFAAVAEAGLHRQLAVLRVRHTLGRPVLSLPPGLGAEHAGRSYPRR